MFIKKTLSFTTLAIACGLIACSEQPTAPAGEVDGPVFSAAQAASTFTTNEWIDLTGQRFFNRCTDEWIVAAGRVHVEFHVTEKGDEEVQVSGHANLAGVSATGEDSGLIYRIVGRSRMTFGQLIFTPGGAEVDHFVQHQRFVSKGSAEDFVIKVGFHFTVNANGDLVSSHLFTEPFSCH